MSFWSFIGLVGKREYEELQSKIDFLIEENRLLREDNKRYFQSITDENDKCFDKIMQQFQSEQEKLNASILDVYSEIGRMIKILKTTHSELQELILSYNAEREETENGMINCQQKVYDLILKLDKEVKNSNDKIQKLLGENTEEIIENIHNMHEICIANIKRILEKSEDIGKQTDSLEETHSTVVALAESVQNLWLATKLIWVDSLINDIDSLG